MIKKREITEVLLAFFEDLKKRQRNIFLFRVEMCTKKVSLSFSDLKIILKQQAFNLNKIEIIRQ